MADGRFRWGVLGTGNIARQFCGDLKSLPGHELTAVASRDHGRAAAFCRDFGGEAVGGYDAVLTRDDLDGVYVSLPNAMHEEWAVKLVDAGHAVLCEKPLATDAAAAGRMFEAADRAGRPLVEAFMYRCHPQTWAVVKAVRGGVIGELTSIRASFGYRTTKTDGNVRFDPALAGGALMDVGCYCLDAAALLADAPVTTIHAVRRLHDRGVDVAASGVIGFASGVQATFQCAMDTPADNALVACGTGGYLTVAVPWKPREDAGYTVHRGTPPRQDLKPGQKAVAPPPQFTATPADLPLYALEADTFARHVRGEVAAFMPREHSLNLARMLDSARQ